ncbi:MAG: alkaline shock response membrane anchor protein AmaP [Lactobacillus sp.]|jgi:uncharacterized alkaline shock family protein YloU|nr:alkaline shock response membrane anchor protein AmaP [Lactobacillus sp.]
MRKTAKILLSLVALFGLLQVVWFAALVYPIPTVSAWLAPWRQNSLYQYIGLGLAAFSALVFLTLLMIALFRRQTTRQLSFDSNKGQLNIDQGAVAKTIRHTVAENYPVQNVDVAVRLVKRQKAAVATVDAVLFHSENLVGISQAIKEAVVTQLQQSLGVPVKKVTVNLQAATENRPAARVI